MERESAREKADSKFTYTKYDRSIDVQTEEPDLLEPQFYPDASLFRTSLQGLSEEEEIFIGNLTSNKATLRALAPYLRILHRDHKRIIESAKRRPKFEGITLKPKDQIISVVPDLSDNPELVSSVVETGDKLKDLVKARKVFIYLVDHAKNVLHCLPYDDGKEKEVVILQIEKGATMAAYAAYNKDLIMSTNVLSDSRFPQGLGNPDSLAKFGIGVPIKTPDDDIIAVYEIIRDGLSVAFDKRDIQIVLAVTEWMGTGILQKAIYENLQRQYEMTQILQQLSLLSHCRHNNIDDSFSEIILFAREMIEAEHCIFYLVIKMAKDYFIVEEYEQELEDSKIITKKYTKRVIQQGDSHLYEVLSRKEVLNIYGKGIDETDPAVRSILCVPILCSCKEVFGAVQLTNKRYEENFSKDDEMTMMTFSSFFFIQLNHSKAINSAIKAERQRIIISNLLSHHIRPCTHDLISFKTRKGLVRLPEEFFTFAWYPSPDNMPHLAEITLSMFQEVIGDPFMSFNNVPKFILTVQSCYRPNPYHNFLHAFVVTHTMANIVSRYHYVFNGLERQGLMIAALCHDVDHRGYTNNFIQVTKHYLSSLYTSSPLENHHFAVAKMIIQNCELFAYLKPQIYDALLTGIYKYIIATDLALYFQSRLELMRIADENKFSFKNPSHRHLVMSMIMTTCDLSGQTKPMDISSKITEDVYEEFFQQGDIEKKMDYVPIPSMDRDKKDMILENQVQFLSVVVIPCIETVSQIFTMLTPMVEVTKDLLVQWKKLVKKRSKF